MIRIDRTLGHCASCAGPVSTYWPAPVAAAPVLVLRIAASTRSGAGGTIDLDEHHARKLVHSPEYDDGRCISCGRKGSVQVIGASTVGTRTRYALSLCRAKCAAGLAGRIGVALALGDGESTEWDESYVPPSWQSASEQIRDAMDFARRGGRR